MTRPKDEMGSQIVSSESDRSHPILSYLSRNNNSHAQARRFPALTAPEPEFPVIFGSKWDPLTSAWRQGGASPERLAELSTGVSPLQKRIWKWDFYHCSSCNFFFHIIIMFLSFMVRTSPFLSRMGRWSLTGCNVSTDATMLESDEKARSSKLSGFPEWPTYVGNSYSCVSWSHSQDIWARDHWWRSITSMSTGFQTSK